jgi:hypothetical protein
MLQKNLHQHFKYHKKEKFLRCRKHEHETELEIICVAN